MYYNKLVLSDGSVLFSNIISASLTTSCNTEDDITPGSVCASSVDVEFWVNSNEEFSITQGATFTYYKVDDSGEETKIGVFICEKPEKDGQNQYKFTAYDNVTLLDKDVSDWVNNKVSFPITISEFATALAKECGLSLANDVLVNGSYEIQKFTANGVSGRDLMKFVCQAGGCFGFANPNGEIEFGWFKENSDVSIGPKDGRVFSFPLFSAGDYALYEKDGLRLYDLRATGVNVDNSVAYYSGGLSYSDYSVLPIDKVQIKQTDSDVGVISPSDASGKNAIVISGNILLSATSDDQIRSVADALYEHLKNISYVPCNNISVPETLKIKVGDILSVTDGKVEFKTWVTGVKYSGGKCTIESVGNASRETTSAVNNQSFNAKQKYLEIQTTIDGLSINAAENSINYLQNSSWRGINGNASVGEDGVLNVLPSSSYISSAVKYVSENDLKDFNSQTVTVSLEYKITEKIPYFSSSATGIQFNYDYKDGWKVFFVVRFSPSEDSVNDVSDWVKVEKSFSLPSNSEITRAYVYAYMPKGIPSGAFSVRNVSVTIDKSTLLSLTSGGVSLSSAKIDLSAYVGTGEVRSRFAMDDSSVTIESGTITFTSNTLIVQSDNFNLDKDGNVQITGDFYSTDGQNQVEIKDGLLRLWRKISDGSTREAATLAASGTNASCGNLYLLGPKAGGGQTYNVVATSSFSGGALYVYNAAGQIRFQVNINGSGDAEVYVNGSRKF